MFSPRAAPKRERCRVALRLAAQGARGRRRAEPPRAASPASPPPPRARACAVRTPDGRRAHRRHARARARPRSRATPPDILITTPESLYLLLTSEARDGARLGRDGDRRRDPRDRRRPSAARTSFLSLERLEALRPRGAPPLQRIGLSATQRPLDEVARLLGGGSSDEGAAAPGRRSSTPAAKKAWDLRVEVPVEDMGRLGEPIDEIRSGDAAQAPSARPRSGRAIHPRLVELIRAHRSTMIFVNSRRLAERLAAALNEVAGEEIALAHHGSVAREQRVEIEERLKRGDLPRIVATSLARARHRHGRGRPRRPDRGAAVASRRASSASAAPATTSARVSRGRDLPEVPRRPPRRAPTATRAHDGGRGRGDVLPAEPARRARAADRRRSSRSDDDRRRRASSRSCAAPRPSPSSRAARSRACSTCSPAATRRDEFAELRPRVTWDRVTRHAARARGRASASRSSTAAPSPTAASTASSSRGGDEKASRRVGELDEEMVFESREGEVFLLGASSWRIDRDHPRPRARRRPRPASPARCPSGTATGPVARSRSARAIGALARTLAAHAPGAAAARLREGARPRRARRARTSSQYLREQVEATGEVPERPARSSSSATVDEIGDWRVCVLSPFGARVHAPWCMRRRSRASARASDARRRGRVVRRRHRLPPARAPTSRPTSTRFFPPPTRSRTSSSQALGGSSLFAARFRENAGARAAPAAAPPGPALAALGAAQARRRSARGRVALRVVPDRARDVPRVPARRLRPARRSSTCSADVRAREIRVVTVDTRGALALRGVAPLLVRRQLHLRRRRAARRAPRAGARGRPRRSCASCSARPSCASCSTPSAIAELERSLQRLDGHRAPSADALHDLLLSPRRPRATTRSRARVDARPRAPRRSDRLSSSASGASFAFAIAGETRFVAAEDAARFRDALGVVPAARPARRVPRARRRRARRSRLALRAHARAVHARRRSRARFGARRAARSRGARSASPAPGASSRARSRPGGRGREWCDAEVLATRSATLARGAAQGGRARRARGASRASSLAWQGVGRPRASGPDALARGRRAARGRPLAGLGARARRPAGARRPAIGPSDLDMLCAAGEVVWVGVEPLGPHDGRIALYLADQLAAARAARRDPCEGELAGRFRELLAQRGALFFAELVARHRRVRARRARRALGSGLGRRGDERHLRAAAQLPRRRRRARAGAPGSSRLMGSPRAPRRSAGQRRPLVAGLPRAAPSRRATPSAAPRSRARCSSATASSPARRSHAEGISGGFTAVYEVLKAMEEAGRVRRGYFVAGLGAAQFALPGRRRRLRAAPRAPRRRRGRRARRDRSREPVRRRARLARARERRAARVRSAPPARTSSSGAASSSATRAAPTRAS